jgi:DNA-binding XRE family transcriptional regulator
MPNEYSHGVNMSSVHTSAIESGCELFEIHAMDTLRVIGNRLEMTREALGLSAAEICRQIDVKPNRWSQYQSGERRITLEIADRLCSTYGLTLDWIYRGSRVGLNPAVSSRIKIVA